MWLTHQERTTLAGLGLLLLAGLGALCWQRQRTPLAVVGLPTDIQPAQSLGSASRPRSAHSTPLSAESRAQSRDSGFRSAGQPGGASWDEALQAAREVDVNTAGAAELERLPGVGPALAARIVEYRAAHGPFGAPEELTRVQGIGPKTLAAISRYLSVKE